jgi:hypothetical protein
MKKLFLLTAVLLAAISVAAQSYDTVSINPNTMNAMLSSNDVYGTTWGQCIGVCTNQCLEEKQGSREECDKLCTDKCHPQPDVITKRIPPRNPVQPIQPQPRTCDDVCELKFKVCGDSQRGTDCKSLFEQCAKGCQPQPTTCEGKCRMIQKECMDNGISKEMCNDETNKCMTQCQPQPMSCDQKCAVMIKDCRSIGGSDEDCGLKMKECVRRCNPQQECPPAGGCGMSCADGYYKCSEIAKTMKAEAGDPATVLEYYMMKCRKGVAECLDACRPGEAPQPSRMRCEGCAKIIDECLKAGVDEVSCKLKVDDCMHKCNPEKPLETEQIRRPERTSSPSVRETGDISLLGRIWHIFSG